MPEDPKKNQEGPGKKLKSEEPTRAASVKKLESEEPTRPDLEKRVNDLKQELDTAQKKLDDFNAANKEIDKAVEEYGKVFERLKKERFDLDDYITTKSLMIGAVVKPKKVDEINKIVEEIGKGIIAAEESSKKAFDKAKKDYESAVTTLKALQDAYESAKGFQKEIEARLKTLDNNRKAIEQEEGKNYAVMYYLNDIESKKVLDELKTSCQNLTKLLQGEIPGDDPGKQQFVLDAKNEFSAEFKKRLDKARKDLEEQEKDLKLEEKKKKVQEAEKTYNEAQKKLAELNKDRKSKILEKLREIKFTEEVQNA